MPAERALPRRPGFILATVVLVLLAVGVGGAISMKSHGKKTRVEAAVTTSTVTTPSSTTVGPPPDPSTTATTVAPTTVPTTAVAPPTVAPPAVPPPTTTTRPRPVTASSRPPRPTIPPTTVAPPPPTSPPTAPPTTPAPPAACTATMASATPSSKPGSTDTVSITSNVPYTSGTVILHAKPGDQRYVVVTDAAGHAVLTFSTGGFVVAYTVVASVDVGGRASCSTSFTPQ